MNKHVQMSLLGLSSVLTTTLAAEAQTHVPLRHNQRSKPHSAAVAPLRHLVGRAAHSTALLDTPSNMPALKKTGVPRIAAKLSRGTTILDMPEVVTYREKLPKIATGVDCYAVAYKHVHKGAYDAVRLHFADANNNMILEGAELVKVETNDGEQWDYTPVGIAAPTSDNGVLEYFKAQDNTPDSAMPRPENDLREKKDLKKFMTFMP